MGELIQFPIDRDPYECPQTLGEITDRLIDDDREEEATALLALSHHLEWRLRQYRKELHGGYEPA